MHSKLFYLGTLFYLYYRFGECKSKSVTYIDAERPVIMWYNKKYVELVNVTSRRISRQDPRHYMELYFRTLFTMNNDLKLDFYFYQFLTNRYSPSFVEMHFSFCNMTEHDMFFGMAVRQALGNISCPIPPGEYTLKNMAISYVPKKFPFPKGRIYLNMTFIEGNRVSHIVRARIDMELKVATIKNDVKN